MKESDLEDVDILGKDAELLESNRTRRRREEAVRRLVSDVHRRSADATAAQYQQAAGHAPTAASAANNNAHVESHEWLVASTVATALERGLDKELHSELVQEAKENAARIGQVCHDHSDAFLASVARVVALGNPSKELQQALDQANSRLQQTTAGQMLEASVLLQHAKEAHGRARTLAGMVTACHNVAVLLDRARKQASLGRPRAALDAVDEARHCLTAPVSSLLLGTPHNTNNTANSSVHIHPSSSLVVPSTAVPSGASSTSGATATTAASTSAGTEETTIHLEETPFGRRAMLMLPKIENEVLMGARRGLNRWFLALRSGGDGAKAGRSALYKCANSMAVGPGQLGLGGHLPPSFLWRAKVADNLLARIDQTTKVARATRLGYWFERDGIKEAERLENVTLPGMERRGESFATAFGWYRCWEETAPLWVDISELNLTTTTDVNASTSLSSSRHGGSRHGKRGTLSFRGGTGKSTAAVSKRETHSKSDGGRQSSNHNPWASLLTPAILFDKLPSRKDDDNKLMGLQESVHPVRRAELAFNLLGRSDEFVQYYEQNRFGEMKIGGSKDAGAAGGGGAGADDDKKNETRSYLSSLTGDDVSVGTDRVFFAKSLPHLCSSVVGFSAVEAALELGHFDDEDEDEKHNKTQNNSASRFRDSSARYERSLVTELGQLLRSRAIGASLAELARSSCLISAFRSALKIVHPSSSTRRSDKELLAMDIDIVMTALKVAQDEQLKVTKKIAMEDRKESMVITTMDHMMSSKTKSNDSIPDEELVGLPFGLHDMKQKAHQPPNPVSDANRNSRQAQPKGQYYTFSKCVPEVVRSIHARAITCAAFALSQEELGQLFSQKKGSGSACYVLDCVEECVSVAAFGMQDGDSMREEGSVDKAVQTMANVAALQHSLPRLFGTLMRGMCHVGMIRSDQIEDTFQYAETTLKGAERACDSQVGQMYNLVYEICRGKIDNHINFALDNFQWVSKAAREMPNPYCEGLIQYLQAVFSGLGPMDEGSRFGLHFSCCSHVAERMVKLLSDPPHEHHQLSPDDHTIAPISRIDAFGLKNLGLDVKEFERFAEGTGVPQLGECFNELGCLVHAMLDRDLPRLLMPENASERRKKYPVLSMNKIGNILEKYVGMGLGDKLMGNSTKRTEILMLEKKEVQQLIRLVRSQDT